MFHIPRTAVCIQCIISGTSLSVKSCKKKFSLEASSLLLKYHRTTLWFIFMFCTLIHILALLYLYFTLFSLRDIKCGSFNFCLWCLSSFEIHNSLQFINTDRHSNVKFPIASIWCNLHQIYLYSNERTESRNVRYFKHQIEVWFDAITSNLSLQ